MLNRVDQSFWKAAAKEPACLTVFAGGQAAQAWLQRSPAQRRELASQELDTLFPGYNGHSQSQIFCLWPNKPWTRCGYSAPSPGQLSRVYPRLEAGWQDKLFSPGTTPAPASTVTWGGAQ